jgi:hypothetical protein
MKSFDDFDIFYQPPAEIREHKDSCYTITPIGGPKELAAWRENQALKLADRKQAQREIYLVKRSLASEIFEGRAQASEEALKQPETLARFKQQFGKTPTPSPIQPSNIDVVTMPKEAPPEAPTWFEKVVSWFRL